MLILGFIQQSLQWWDALSAAQQIFYGIGIFAAFVALILAVLGFTGLEHHDAVDVTTADFDHGGGGIFSVKPLTGFFLGFGWAGATALESGLPLLGALGCAFLAGGVMMAIIVAMFRFIYAMRSDGTVRIADSLGAVGTVYVTLPPARAAGGQVIVTFRGRQETLSALSVAPHPVASGEKVKVVEIIDSRTVLVQPLT